MERRRTVWYAFDLVFSLVPNKWIVGKWSGASGYFRLVFATQQGAHTSQVAVHYMSPFVTGHSETHPGRLHHIHRPQLPLCWLRPTFHCFCLSLSPLRHGKLVLAAVIVRPSLTQGSERDWTAVPSQNESMHCRAVVTDGAGSVAYRASLLV